MQTTTPGTSMPAGDPATPSAPVGAAATTTIERTVGAPTSGERRRPGWWAHTGTEVAPGLRTGGMVPPDELLPQVLPTDRLSATARPVNPLRDELRRTHSYRNVGNVVLVWAQTLGLFTLAAWVDHPALWVATFFLMGRGFALFAILGHEAAHRLLFARKRANDWVGKWLVAYPSFMPIDLYRRSHMAHHRDEFGPGEPDMAFYGNYPITRASFRRKLTRDAFFVSGWKNMKPLLLALRRPEGRPLALSILGVQAAIAVVMTAIAVTLVGSWWAWLAYPLFWLAPYMSVWRVINRLRSIGEHGGLERSSDRRRTTHHVRQHWLARFWMVPYRTGWHLAHHVDPGVPFQNLPRLHHELVDAGWVVPEVVYPSYTSLWRALSSKPES